MLNGRTRALVTLAVALVVCAAPASAQRPRPDRPYRGLFGGNGADPNNLQQLDLNASLYASYDDNVLADRSQANVDPRFQKSGNYELGTVSLDYTRRVSRVSFDFTGGSSYRYYPSIRELDGTNSFVSAGLTVKLSSHTELRATESASYAPYYSFGSLPGVVGTPPGDVAPITSDFPLLSDSTVEIFSTASIEHRLTPRLSLTADYLLQYTNYRAEHQTLDAWSGGARFGYKLTSRATARIGYHYRHISSPFYYAGQAVVGHDIDLGVDYNRSLSFSRRTTVGFTTGTAVYRSFTPNGDLLGTDWSFKTHYMVTGSAYLTRQMGRSWSSRLSYQRGVQYVPGFGNPFFADSFSATLNGYVGLRSKLGFSAGYSNGQVGIAMPGQDYQSYQATANYQYALTKYLALTADYFYYHYKFAETVPLPSGMNHGLNRQSVRVGLNLWAPLVR